MSEHFPNEPLVRPDVPQNQIDRIYETVFCDQAERRYEASSFLDAFFRARHGKEYQTEVQGAYPGMRPDEYDVTVYKESSRDPSTNRAYVYAATVAHVADTSGRLQVTFCYAPLTWKIIKTKEIPEYGSWKEEVISWEVTPAIVKKAHAEKETQDRLDKEAAEQYERDREFLKAHMGETVQYADLPKGFWLATVREGQYVEILSGEKDAVYLVVRDADNQLVDMWEYKS